MDRSGLKRGGADGELGNDNLVGPSATWEPTGSADSHLPEQFINPYAEAKHARGIVRQPFVTEPEDILEERKDHLSSLESAPVTDELNGADNPPVEPTDDRSAPADSVLRPSESGVTPRLMTIDDVAAYCRMSKSKIARLEKRDPDFPRPIRIGGSTRWDKDAIDRYIDQMGLRNGEGS